MGTIKVSVIIPTYKRATMLPRAIKSVLNQTYSNIEVVVVDDNNPKSDWRLKTEKIMDEFKSDSRVVYIKHPENKNGSAARNTGVNSASGEVITYLDDDDWYYSEKIEKQLSFLLNNPRYRAVYCGWKRFGYEIPDGDGDLSFGILSGQNIIITNSIMMWKKDTIECGGWDESLKRHQEASLLLNFFANGGLIGRISDILVEFDISDRGNVVNPQKNEEIISYLFNKYGSLIDRCESASPGSKKRIFCLRYRGVILSYLKNKNIIGGLLVYLKMSVKYPYYLNKVFLDYIKQKIFK